MPTWWTCSADVYGDAGRGGREGNRSAGLDRYPPPAQLSAVVRLWYCEMTLKIHPDRGGSHERMVALTLAKDRLEEMLGIR